MTRLRLIIHPWIAGSDQAAGGIPAARSRTLAESLPEDIRAAALVHFTGRDWVGGEVMARAKDQARWRQKSDRRRVEVYLPAEIAERLDALAAERGESRAAVIAALVSGETASQERESEL